MQIINTIDSNLFEIAASRLGDALQWINIARANNLTDPILVGQNKIIVPPYSTLFLDGVGPQ